MGSGSGTTGSGDGGVTSRGASTTVSTGSSVESLPRNQYTPRANAKSATAATVTIRPWGGCLSGALKESLT